MRDPLLGASPPALREEALPDRVDGMSADAIKDFFPDFSDIELRRAHENLDLYLELAWEIYEEPQNVGPADA
jgi:hypothetical protein